MALTALFKNKEKFCALLDNSLSECQTKMKELTNLKATGKKIQQRFSSAEYYFKTNSIERDKNCTNAL